MLEKKFWIPIVLVLILAIGGIFGRQRIVHQEPKKVYTTFPEEPLAPSKLNEWRWYLYRPLEDISVDGRGLTSTAIYVPLSTTKAVEKYLRTTTQEDIYVRVRDNYVARHYKKYPNCRRQHASVLTDAKRTATWFIADMEYMNKYWKLTAEFDGVEDELISLFEKYDYRPAYEATHIAESERLKDVKRVKTLMAAFEENGERKDALNREKPIMPKPTHTH